jgi:CheY-like chemotaxis protein
VLELWSAPSDPPDPGNPAQPSVARAPTGTDRGGSPILEGLAHVDRRAPSLILLDMRMPRMDGWEFAAALRARRIASPLVVMTAAESAKRWADEVGADGYVVKLFELLDLLASVAKHRRLPPRN